MSTSRKGQQLSDRYSEELVLRVNELFYDATQQGYEYIHEEMLEQERERWRRNVQRLVPTGQPLTLIDIGSGGGFVPVTIAPFLKPEDRLICSDLSSGMLEIARQNIARQNFACQFDFVKIPRTIPYSLPFPSQSADVITMNSVLHHIKETGRFLQEVDRVLKPGGRLFIAHEPNKNFREHPFLWRNYRFLSPLANPKLVLTEMATRIGISGTLRKIYYMFFPEKKKAALAVINGINEVLFREKLVTEPVTLENLGAITDIRDQEGFKPDRLLPDYEVLHLETYNHMLLVTIKHFKNPLLQRYERMLRSRYPDAGATFFLVLRKKG
jgi:ubiquinone/menaquinone biosynthesis C-methylase UbiE